MPIGPTELAHFWDLAPSGHAVIDEHGILLAANRTLADWVGEPAAALAGRPASDLFTSTARVLYLGLLAYRLAERGRAEEVHLELAVPGTLPLPVLCSGRRIRYRGAHLILLTLQEFSRKHALEKEMLASRQASERVLSQREAAIAELESLGRTLEARRLELEAINQRLGHEATTDPLTGLPNRRRLDEALLGTIRHGESRSHHGSFSLALLDVDHFKQINDRHGHAAGDRVLVRLAALLEATLRGDDLAARIGGEEFALLMPHTPMAAARSAMQRLLEAIRAHDWEGLRVTASSGLTDFRPGDTPQTMLERADRALYAAKAAGRDRIADG